MQCKDVSDRVVLAWLARHRGTWTTHGTEYGHMPSLMEVLLAIPQKLRLAKMKQLLRRGLVNGCGCGCRGDWEITDAGLALIGAEQAVEFGAFSAD